MERVLSMDGSDNCRVRLAASLDLKAAGPLHQELRAARGSGVALEAGDVRRLGGQCLQVLIAARAAWAEDGLSFEIEAPSPAFVEGAALMGAADLLGVSKLEQLA
jgi:chemotaxis protein CheX